MIPTALRTACGRLLGACAYDGERGRKEVFYPPHEEQVARFLAALTALAAYRYDDEYALYMRTTLGYYRCLFDETVLLKEASCFQVDWAIIPLLRERPEIIPEDCYADRLPGKTLLMEVVRLLRRRLRQISVTEKHLRRLAAD